MSKETKKKPDAPVANPNECKVEFVQPCIFKGKRFAKGDKLTVTKLVAEHLATRKLIKE